MFDAIAITSPAGFRHASARKADIGKTRPWRQAAARLVSPTVLILLWQAVCMSGLVSPRILPSPLRIAATFAQLVADGTLGTNLAVSLGRVLIGLGIALVLGVGLALIAGLSRLGDHAVDAPLQMVRTMPHLALVPLFIMWFGIGETPKIALVTLGALFPLYLNLLAGIRGIDPRLRELARTLRLTRAQTIRHIVLPGALPSALTGLRYAVGMAWLTLVVAEQINASSGIGFMMMDARDFMRTDIILVGLLIYAALGLATDAGVRGLEHVAMRYRRAD